jgi:hypothetical protein
MAKSGREIMEIFEAFDLTGTAWSAAQLTGCDAKTVARYVAVREAAGENWWPPAWKSGGHQPGNHQAAQLDFSMAVDTDRAANRG